MLRAMRGVIHVCVDDAQLAQLEEQVRFHAPKLEYRALSRLGLPAL